MMKSIIQHICPILLVVVTTTDGFAINIPTAVRISQRQWQRQLQKYSSERLVVANDNDFTSTSPPPLTSIAEDDDQQAADMGPIRAPLKFIGPYIGLGLNFPDLATSSQRQRNLTGVALDFVLDTAANINTIQQQVALELQLEQVGEAPGGISASGPIVGGHTYVLGSCELEGLTEKFLFMENLSASALPVASPAAAGLLAMPFFHCFGGGVEFDWGGNVDEDGVRLPPSVTFYGEADESADLRQNMTRILIEELPVTRLPKVHLRINGVTIPALFDTGSPVTVINAQAAQKAGVSTVQIGQSSNKQSNNNLFSGLVNKFKDAQAAAQAAARGDVLSIAGTGGERVDLFKSESPVDIQLSPSMIDDDEGGNGSNNVHFGSRNIYVGNIPGLAALDALGDEAPPAAVLGMDVLRSKPKMLLVARNNEVYF